MPETIIDTTDWPRVWYVMPARVSDEEAPAHIAALQAVLDRREPFVLIFSGVELPKDSAAFFRLYRQWGKETRALQQQFCRGAVRVEPDAGKRRSLWRKALQYLTSRSVPYPYQVVADAHAAERQAQRWLQDIH